MTAQQQPQTLQKRQNARLGTVNGLAVVLFALSTTLALAGLSEVEFRKAAAIDAAQGAATPVVADCPRPMTKRTS